MNDNAIINTDYRVWNEQSALEPGQGNTCTAECWNYGERMASGKPKGQVRITRDTDVPTTTQAGRKIPYSLRIECIGANPTVDPFDLSEMQVPIEGPRYETLLAGRQVTCGGWIKSDKTGVHGVAFTNGGLDRCYVAELTVNAANTWEYKTVTIPAPPSDGGWQYGEGQVGIYIFIQLSTGSDYQCPPNQWTVGNYSGTSNQVNLLDAVGNKIRFAGWSLNAGSTVDYRLRSPEEEILLTERFWESSYPSGVLPGSVYDNDFTWTYGNALLSGGRSERYRVKKATTPTIKIYSPITGAVNKVRDYSNGADLNVLMARVGKDEFCWYANLPVAGPFNVAGHWVANSRIL